MENFNDIPIWIIFLLTLGLVTGATEIGYRLGMRRRGREEDEPGLAVGAMVGAMLGLLAFMLAFTTGFALNQFQNRRGLVIADANAIGTLFLRTDFLDEPDRTAARELLREYVDLRLEAALRDDLASVAAREEEIQLILWDMAVDAGHAHPESEMAGLLVASLNEMIDIHGERLAVVKSARIPALMWLILYTLAFVSFLLLGVENSADGKRNLLPLILFTLGFSAVIMLLVDLDRTQQGWIIINQGAMIDLQNMIEGIR